VNGQVRPEASEKVPNPNGAARFAALRVRHSPSHNQPRQKMFGKSLQLAVTSQGTGHMGNVGLEAGI